MLEILKELSKKYPNNMELGHQARQSKNKDVLDLCLKYPNDMTLGAEIRKLVN